VTLAPGARLGPYQVTARIGAGGMGEVYRATDTRLGRDVAIKVLPDAVARDKERLSRFDREARALASLNHPNIATVHGLEGEGGTTALVMEFVEGPTLAERITKGPIPVPETLAIARQIADALEAAHERGIVHRDLKPGNVMIRPDGAIKVLDFGLAKDLRAAGGQDAATVTAATEAGEVMGTPAYMSPEQARGEPVDRRTDIWAFGCVLFEMLTGARTFEAASSAETVARVLTKEVEWSSLPGDVPTAVRHLLIRCLHRDARRRLRDIGEARLILEHPGAPHEAAETTGETRASWRGILAVATGALLVGGIIGALLVWRGGGSDDLPLVTHTSIPLAEGSTFTYPGRRHLAVDASGRYLTYTAGGLWLRALAERDARLVPGVSRDARVPFFSPDGQSLGYYASGALWRVSVTGGGPTRLTEAVNPWGASWGRDGTILYGQGPDGIWRVPDAGGKGARLITPRDGETMFSPQLLPGGGWVLYSVLPAGVGLWDQSQIVMESLSSGERVTLVNGGRDGRYLPTGHLVFALRDTLLAMSFDVETRQVGAAVRLVQDVADALGITGAAQFDLSETGTLVYVPRSIPDRLTLTWVDRTGREEAVPGEARAYRHPRVSPDGQRLVVELREDDDTNVWVGDRRGTFAPLTLENGDDSSPIWSPDGSRVVFFSARNGGGLFSRSATATSADHLLVSGIEWRPSTWTAEGSLVYEQLRGAEIVVMGSRPGEASQAITLVNNPSYFDILHPAISPDGRWLAYHSTESGQSDVYVRPFPNVDDHRRLVSSGEGGYSPVWSTDGRELFYIEGAGHVTRPQRLPDSRMMSVAIRTQPTLAPGTPVSLFEMRDFVTPSPQSREYDVGPDGRFIMLKDVMPGGTRAGNQIVVVQNWTTELRARVPATP
jgi:serine/threonine-protein kinase